MQREEMLAVNALRFLSVDMINQANSGHPGIAIDAAPMAYTLWERVMNFNPRDPEWLNRDRFILSAGHGSALLYSLLHLNGFDLSLADLKAFRQLGSKTPGHPEYGWTPGVDASTGPLSQGLGMAVGLAMAEKHLAAVYNRPGLPLIDHYTYVLAGDGDLMEGLSQEAINLAGQLGLGKLIVLYDSNQVSLDGPLSLSSHEDPRQRLTAAGWQYLVVDDGNADLDAIEAAIKQAQQSTQPTMIEVKTTIGYGAPNGGTNKVHGAPLGEEGRQAMADFYSWSAAPFEIVPAIRQRFETAVANKRAAYDNWRALFDTYRAQYPKEARQLANPQLSVTGVATTRKPGEKVATRQASAEVLQTVAGANPQFWGGAADLASSNKTFLDGGGTFGKDTPAGKNIFFGVREFGMAAAVNGINLHGGTRAFGSTFLVFTDYLRAAIRQAALMHLPSIFIGTHDSIAVGEDGPTHQPVEQLASFRAMPNLNVIRPADANETAAAWRVMAQTTDRPSLLVASRQSLPVLEETVDAPVERGGYVLADSSREVPDGIIIAAGSEVALALQARELLFDDGIDVRVVSMPSTNLFDEQPKAYRDAVLPPQVTRRLAVEMGASQSWYKYVGLNGKVMGVDRFGISGPGAEVVKALGFTPEHIFREYKHLNKTNYLAVKTPVIQ
ncbi:transketolase [Limosilactobacillus fermentum]